MDDQADEWLGAVAARLGLSVGPRTAVVLQDRSGAIVGATERAEATLGLSRDQLLGRTSADPRWVAVDRDGQVLGAAEHPAMRALRTGHPVERFVLGVHRPSEDAAGEHVWLTVTSHPVSGQPGVLAGSVITVFDPVAGNEQLELRSRDSERKYRLLAENSSDMVAWQGIDSTFLWVAPAAQAVLGYSPDELIGTRGLDLVHPDDLPRVRALQLLASSSESSLSGSATKRLRHADGSWRWIETTARVVEENGTKTGMITSRRDVTARVEAERERDEAVEIFRLAMEHAPAGMALISAEGHMQAVNQALCRILGRLANELIGHPIEEFAAHSALDPARASGSPEDGPERQFLRADGALIWCQSSLTVLPTSRARSHALIQLLDVTAQQIERARLAQAAHTDALTGLPNRSALSERLRIVGAVQPDSVPRDLGILFVDLDGFKAVNDTWGHDVGDELLRSVAHRLTAVVRRDDLVTRLGGDEFVILCEDTAAVNLDGLAARIQSTLGTPFAIAGNPITVSASVGVTWGSPSQAHDLLNQADKAMYAVKRARKGHEEPRPVIGSA